ncbi:MAG: MurR/RpiR family transcriptional regulator [Oscillospiraceae bacterium]
MSNDIMASINSKMVEFSKGQRIIARYILEHYDKAAFMTAAKLGQTVGVSESTVVRFASEIGYEGYPQLQKSLQEMIRNRLTTVQRMEVTNEQIGSSNVLSKVLTRDMERIKKTLEETSKEDFQKAVNAIIKAKNIYILGIRSATCLSRFMSFYFNHIFDNVKLVNTASTSEMFEQIFRLNGDDVFIAISFPRYSQRTINAAKYAVSKGATVIGITDAEDSPIVANSNIHLLAKSDTASFVDSLVAPLSLINALIVAVGLEKKDEISQTYEELEQIWDAYDVYQKTEGL